MKKKVILTGSTGFIGRHAIPILLSNGYEVHCLSRNHNISSSPAVINHQIDLLNLDAIDPLIKEINPSHLLHLAWYVVPRKFWTAKENLDWVAASIKLYQSFTDHGGKRAVFAGSSAEYDWSTGLCDEKTTPLRPSTLYGACKASLYQILHAYSKQTNQSFAWGRVFFLYGPHEQRDRLVPNVIEALLANQIAKCSQGTQKRDFLHVEDVANAFVSLLENRVEGAVNIASGDVREIKEVTNMIAEIIGSIDQIHYGAHPTPPNDPEILKASVDRLFSEMQWKPKYSLKQGLEETISWWKQQDLIT